MRGDYTSMHPQPLAGSELLVKSSPLEFKFSISLAITQTPRTSPSRPEDKDANRRPTNALMQREEDNGLEWGNGLGLKRVAQRWELWRHIDDTLISRDWQIYDASS
jgi:hypothetical protein